MIKVDVEYEIISIDEASGMYKFIQLKQKLNELGKDGWYVACVIGNNLILYKTNIKMDWDNAISSEEAGNIIGL